jgi:hypothetical protein
MERNNNTSALPADEQQFESLQDIPAEQLRQQQDPEAEITDEPDDVQEQSPAIAAEPTANLDELKEQTGTE